MDGGDALPDPKARRGERRDELECARLQLETGHESHRCQRFDEGAVELKKRRFWHPRGCKTALAYSRSLPMQAVTLTMRSLSQRTSILQKMMPMSVFTHSGPTAAGNEGQKSAKIGISVNNSAPFFARQSPVSRS